MAGGPFNEGVVQQNGGVAWAKQQGQILESVPDAIDGQIAGYQAAIKQLQQVHTTVTGSSTQLQSAWNGDAADAATTAFGATADQTQTTIDTINNTITQLQNAKTAAQTAAAALAKVPNEQPVPKPDLLHQALNFVGIESDNVSQVEQQNTQARTQAADALNSLSTSYTDVANNMSKLTSGATKDQSGFNTETSPAPFQPTAGPPASGSGAAGSYVSPKGSTGGGGSGTTRLEGGPSSGTVEAPPIKGSPTPPPGTTTGTGPGGGTGTPGPIVGTPVPDPTSTDPEEPPVGTTAGPDPEETDPLMGSTTGGPDGEGEGSAYGSTSSLFGEDGLESTTGAGVGYGSTSAYGSTSGSGSGAGLTEDDTVGVSAGGIGEGSTSGMQNMGGMRGGMGRGGGGAGAGDDSYNSQYSRGQYLSDEEGAGFATQDWQSPAIGGDESLLIPSQVDDAAGASGQVTSVYDGATDAQGRPMSGGMGMGGRRIQSGDDEEEDRGRRPAYLKEDAEWWQSGQQYNPPVVG